MTIRRFDALLVSSLNSYIFFSLLHVNITLFVSVMPCNVVARHQYFAGMCFLHFILLNIEPEFIKQIFHFILLTNLQITHLAFLLHVFLSLYI
jgi:hypothetical protein